MRDWFARAFLVEMAEWTKATLCKSVDREVYGGSNPPLNTMKNNEIVTFLQNEPLVINWSNLNCLKQTLSKNKKEGCKYDNF